MIHIRSQVKITKVITCDTPPASDHLYQIWKESIQNCRRYRADTIFNVKAELPWKYRSKIITCDTPSDANDDLCQIWKECKQNCRFFFKVKAVKLAKNWNFRTRFSKSRSNDIEDIGQGQRSSHVTHLLMLVIICTKYGKNPSRTVDATKRTGFSRPNDLEDIGQGQRSLYATHPLILVIICAKYGKNPSRTVDFFSRSRPKNFKNSNFQILKKTRNTPSNDSDHLCQIWKESIQNCRRYRADTIF